MDKYDDFVVTGQIGHKPIINIWDSNNMESLSMIVGDLEKGISHVAFSPNGRYVVATAMNDTHDIAIYDVSDIRDPKLFCKSKGVRDLVLDIKVSLDNKSVYLATKNEIYTFHISRKLKIKKVTGWNKKKQLNLCIGFIGKFVAVGLKNGQIALIRGNSISKVIPAHKKIVYAMCGNRENSRLFSGGADGKIILWDEHLKVIKQFELGKMVKSFNPRIRALSFNQEREKLLVGTRGGEIFEIDIRGSDH